MDEYEAANQWLQKRLNLPTEKTSFEISRDFEARQRAHAFFSARVAEDHILERLRGISDAYSRGEIGLAEARTRLKKFLRGEGKDDGTNGLRNLASTARLNLILEQNTRMAAAVGRWQVSMDAEIRDRWPCWRYIGSTARNPRDTHARFAGKVFRKDDPIWHKIYPPSDFGCKCDVEDCDEEPDKAPKTVEPPPSGFAFDPAHAFETFDVGRIKDEALRKKTEEGLKNILRKDKKPEDLLSDREKRQAQWNAAYQKRLERWENEMRQTGLKAEAVDKLLKCYTREAAKNGKPPKVVANPGGKTYLTKDGKILYIGADAKTPEDVARKIGNLSLRLKRGKQYQIAKTNRLRREARLIGAEIISTEHSTVEDLSMTNPKYNRGNEYKINCQRCVTTYEARRRGIDVEALPNYGYDGFGVMMLADGTLSPNGWTSAYKNPKPVYCGAKDGYGTGLKAIHQMEQWGNGARAIVRVQWQGGNTGHVFIAENVNGKVQFIDPQSNDMNVEWYFKAAKKNKTYIIRIDNLKFGANVKKCCKRRET